MSVVGKMTIYDVSWEGRSRRCLLDSKCGLEHFRTLRPVEEAARLCIRWRKYLRLVRHYVVQRNEQRNHLLLFD